MTRQQSTFIVPHRGVVARTARPRIVHERLVRGCQWRLLEWQLS